MTGGLQDARIRPVYGSPRRGLICALPARYLPSALLRKERLLPDSSAVLPFDAPGFSATSRHCEGSPAGALIANSDSAGWTSVLLEHRRLSVHVDPIETPPRQDVEIVVLARGDLELETFANGAWRGVDYRQGQCGVTPTQTPRRLRWSNPLAGRAPESLNLFIPPDVFRSAAEHFRRIGQSCPDQPVSELVRNDRVVAQAVATLLRAAQAGAADLYAESLVDWLAIHLLSPQGAHMETSGGRDPGVLLDRRLARVVEFMNAHFAEPLKLDRLAQEAGISKFHFARRFRESVGLTPHGFLLDLRLNRGRDLLAKTEESVTRIAAACGYERSGHFGAAFQRRFGETPTAYRRRLRS
ncbi:MAG: helix-turn-helix domain-containing protein [Phenylobacterium sp.]